MGSLCVTFEENEEKIKELEILLKEQTQANSAIKQKIAHELRRIKTCRDDHRRVKENFEQVSNEKKHVFKTMLKGRIKVSRLDDQIEDYKKQIKYMDPNQKQDNFLLNTRGYHETINNVLVRMSMKNLLESVLPPQTLLSIGYIRENAFKQNNLNIPISIVNYIILFAFSSADPSDLYSLLHGNKMDSRRIRRRINNELASLLTRRSEGERQRLIQQYREQYGKNLEQDIQTRFTKGHSLQIIHGLLMTRAQFDAELIHECLIDWDIRPVADVICGRKVQQLREIDAAYKKKYKFNMKKHLQALARRDQKRILTKMLGRILDYKRKEDSYVDLSEVNRDLNMIFTTKIFKHEKKEKLVLIFAGNSVQYIKVLNEHFLLKSRDSFQVFLDKKLGSKSTTGFFCKQRIGYALDTPAFYAIKIKDLGKHFRRNQKKISDIFIQRMEIDLDLIQRAWKVSKYGDGKDLKQWIAAKTWGSNSRYFLSKILDNCGSRQTCGRGCICSTGMNIAAVSSDERESSESSSI
eukprot:9518_1